MPLPPATTTRTLVHTRRIELQGWKRDDGLWDIEARLTDVKAHDYPLASGLRLKGQPVHDLWVRATIDREFNVTDAAACFDAVPYPGGCDVVAGSYRRIVGLNLMRGFRLTVAEMFKSVRGCSHMTELLASLPTAALQTIASEIKETEGVSPGEKPFQLDRCHALETTTETVRRYYPRWYRGNPSS